MVFIDLEHHLTHDSGTGPDGSVLKDRLCRLFLVAGGLSDLVNPHPGRGGHSDTRKYTRSGIVGLDCPAGPDWSISVRGVTWVRGGLVW